MRFVKVSGWEDGIEPLAARLRRELLAGHKVLWLVPGGSNIPLSVAVMARLPDELTPGLSILLTDERYGPEDHAESNFRQLRQAGFAPKRATFRPVLRDDQPLEDTRARYELAAQTAFAAAETIVGQLGMGEDGHIAGIMPGSDAVMEQKWAAAYHSSPYVRLTLTPAALGMMSVAYMFAFGGRKREALDNLRSNGSLSLSQQPAQLLWRMPEAYVYSDQVGETRTADAV